MSSKSISNHFNLKLKVCLWVLASKSLWNEFWMHPFNYEQGSFRTSKFDSFWDIYDVILEQTAKERVCYILGISINTK